MVLASGVPPGAAAPRRGRWVQHWAEPSLCVITKALGCDPPALSGCRSPGPPLGCHAPELHTLLTVVQSTAKGSPALSEACRAGACPRLAEQTLPMNTSPTAAAGTEPRASAACHSAGRWVGGWGGVRWAGGQHWSGKLRVKHLRVLARVCAH